MKILRDAGKYEILAIMAGDDPLKLIELAGRTCYKSQGKITKGTAEKFVRMICKAGHESVLEHSYMTVEFSNVSRGFTHELVRHRHMAISQESTRYVDNTEMEVILPSNSSRVTPFNDVDDDMWIPINGKPVKMSIRKFLELNEEVYRTLRKRGWKPEDARQILPNGLKTQIVCSANFREWKHILKLRTHKSAHWEIRAVMMNLLKDVQKMIPIIFEGL